MKIYVSGSYKEQLRLREESNRLRSLGHEVMSTWLQELKQPDHLNVQEWHKALALKDLVDLTASDCIIMDTDGGTTTGGKYVEWGFAIARHNMLKCLVGADNTGVFQELADKSFPDWDAVIAYFKKKKGV